MHDKEESELRAENTHLTCTPKSVKSDRCLVARIFGSLVGAGGPIAFWSRDKPLPGLPHPLFAANDAVRRASAKSHYRAGRRDAAALTLPQASEKFKKTLMRQGVIENLYQIK